MPPLRARPGRRRFPALALAALLALALVAGCQPGTARVTFRPAVGSRYRYELTVHTVVTLHLDGRPADRSDDEVTLRADQQVLSRARDGARVRVDVRATDGTTRSFVARFDDHGRLLAVDSLEGVAADVLGQLGLPEIFPAAAEAPPDRPLAPDARWRIDERVRVPFGDVVTTARVRGEGHLVGLRPVGRGRVATIAGQTRVPLSGRATLRGSAVSLAGTETTSSHSVRDLADGAVVTASSTTTGRFSLTLSPPAGADGEPVQGSVDVEVRSSTRRL